MKTSERELLGLASAAALGMGYPYGIDEDLAKAVVWLVKREADGLGALLSSSPRIGDSLTAKTRPIIVDGVHVGSDGPGLLDLLIADRSFGEFGDTDGAMSLQLRRLDSPLLMVGLCGTVAKVTGKNLALNIGGIGAPAALGELLLIGADDGARITDVDLETMTDAVEILCHASKSTGEQVIAPPVRLVVPDHRWSEAELLAAKTYVPTSEQSRHLGAGAGLTDND